MTGQITATKPSLRARKGPRRRQRISSTFSPRQGQKLGLFQKFLIFFSLDLFPETQGFLIYFKTKSSAKTDLLVAFRP